MSKGGDVTLNMLSDYKVNHVTGEKYLRIAVRQWMTSYDPELVPPTKANRRASTVFRRGVGVRLVECQGR